MMPETKSVSSSPDGKHLVEALRSYSQEKKIGSRRNLLFNINGTLYCYLIFEGLFAVHRLSDDRMLGTVRQPTILGMSGLITGHTQIYLKALTPAVVGQIPTEYFYQVLQEKNLWESLSKHLIYLADRLFIFNEQSAAPSAFDTVYLQLKELMQEDVRIRQQVTAERYIRDKTHLSRSRIMHILSTLKEEGRIEIKRGILLGVNEPPAT